MKLLPKLVAASIMWGALHSALEASPIDVSQTPMFLTVNITPNLAMTIDDSGSMTWAYVPDSIGSSQAKLDGPRFASSSYNPLYYNPKTTYTIPTRSDGVTYTTSYTQAYLNGFNTSLGYVDMSNTTTLTAPNHKGYLAIAEDNLQTNVSNCKAVNTNWDGPYFCRYAKNPSATTVTNTTTPYAFSGCNVTFTKQPGDDAITVSYCTQQPFTFAGTPVGTKITVSNAGAGYNGVYTVNSISSANKIRIAESFGSTATKSNVSMGWSVTTTNTITTTTDVGYYYLYYTDKSGASKPAGCDNSKETDACYILVVVGSNDDIFNGTAAEKQQNFANWFSFYKTRALSAISGAMKAVTRLGTNEVRLAWASLNACTTYGTDCKGYDGVARENRIRPLDATKTGATDYSHRSDFYDWLTRLTINGATPMRSAQQAVGNMFSTDGKNGPYAEDPYVNKGTEYSCRKNFHLLFTDGLWNGDGGVDFGGEIDSTSKTLPDGKTYTPIYPYKNGGQAADGYSFKNNVADLAFKFWANDLNANLANNVSAYYSDRSGEGDQPYWNSSNDPATWQHLVNFYIGLGLGSYLTDPRWEGSTYAGDYSKLAAGTKYWPATMENPSGSDTLVGHIYDLWHAAINSRGQFFSVDDPEALNSAFQSVMRSILASNPSSAALTANSTSIQITGTMVYQAKFDSTDWHGQFLAFPVRTGGSVGSAVWDLANMIPAPSDRKVFGFNGTAGIELIKDCSTLSDVQKGLLNSNSSGVVDDRCSDRLAWLRGDQTKEVRNYSDTNKTATFRNRKVSVLGDIINSDPVYTASEDFGYGGNAVGLTSDQKTAYTSFLAAKARRVPMVYVGGNDGMLHAVRADNGANNSGAEIFAYVPNLVFAKLNRLMEQSYAHEYYVDGAPVIGDAYINSAWKTILVAGLNGGGSGIYALDVTDAASFKKESVLWEYTDSDDLGLTYSQPQIALLNDGVTWAAIFGNGYNSTKEHAALYVVNLETGKLIKKIVVDGVDYGGNGLSSPVLYDSNGDSKIDYVYAGDLHGNLWKFDLSSADKNYWGIANGNQPLFKAIHSGDGKRQPITSRPTIAGGAGSEVMLYFGTGSYISSSDSTNTDGQAFYAVRDTGTVVGVDDLVEQTITGESIIKKGDAESYSVRETSNNPVDSVGKKGWYLTLSSGERVVSSPLVKYDRVVFSTMIPSTDQCLPGGGSWIMELDKLTGNASTKSPFDFDNDGKFDSNDFLSSGHVASGVKSTVGIVKSPVWLGGDNGKDFKEFSGTSGNIMTLGNRGKPPEENPTGSGDIPKKLFWRQIM